MTFQKVLGGVSLREDWRPPDVEVIKGKRGRGDFVWMPRDPELFVISDRAWKALRPLIEADVEVLPVAIEADAPYHFVNILSVLDCLDREKTKFKFRSVDRQPVDIYEYAFTEVTLRGHHIFRPLLAEWGGTTIVSEEFKQCVEQNKLKGVILEDCDSFRL